MGMPIPEEYGGAGARHALVRDRDRGADAHRLVGRDHGRRAHVARDDADLPASAPRSRSSEWLPDLASGQQARRVRADRAGRRLGRRRDAHDAPSCATAQWVVNGSKIFITNAGHRHHRLRDDHRAHRRRRDLEHHRPERHARLRDLGADAEARLARLRHARALVPGLRRARGEPARRRAARASSSSSRSSTAAGSRSRRWASASRRARTTSRTRYAKERAAVRQADREVPGDPVPARRHGDGDRGRPRSSSTRRRG